MEVIDFDIYEAMLVACRKGYVENVKMLMEDDSWSMERDGGDAIQMAREYNQTLVLRYLLEHTTTR